MNQEETSSSILLEGLGFLSLEEYNPLPPNLLEDGGKEWLINLLPSNSLISKEELYLMVLEILQKNKEEEELLDLVGYDSFDLISKILKYKSIFLSRVKVEASVTSNRQLRRMQDKGIIPKKFSDENKNANPIILPIGPQFDATNLPGIFLSPSSMLPSLDDIQMGGGGKICLPKNSSHHQDIHWEEFVLYPDELKNNDDAKELRMKKLMIKINSIKIIEIPSLHPVFSLAFPYKLLNPMQSATFPILTETNENVLVCAPTGAGKTDVALLSILKVMRDNFIKHENGFCIIDGLENLKIVYVAPMKALASEITLKFQNRLKFISSLDGKSFQVREYTGDMQLTPQEVRQTQMIVTTPEKWDVLTRKPSALSVGGDASSNSLLNGLSLLIIDEIHLLQDSRGPVIEAIVARTLRRVELQQKIIRLVGLSATLPNYMDVGIFLRVDPYRGLFAFGEHFRPVPLTQHFIGVKPKSFKEQTDEMMRICWSKVKDSISKGYQAMVFVHSRNETVKTVKALQLKMAEDGLRDSFIDPSATTAKGKPLHKLILQTKDRELVNALSNGFGFHHAGMPRHSRHGVENAFSSGDIKVLCCTSTLAWGVNLPAHTVIIKGTRVYDQQKGDFGSIGILDVLQIFGRAGRPQFQETGEAFLICPHSELSTYLRSILHQIPIESKFLESGLYDNFNAEISLGAITTLDEAISWMRYTYLWVRMQRNPTSYGLRLRDLEDDPQLTKKLTSIIMEASKILGSSGMISFNGEKFKPKPIGRIASTFYLSYQTIIEWGKLLRPADHLKGEEHLLSLAGKASEFEQLRVRDEEVDDIQYLIEVLPLNRLKTTKAIEDGHYKASLLMQAYIARIDISSSFSLQNDLNYVSQNGSRILRALFEVIRSMNWAPLSLIALRLCQIWERRCFHQDHPLLPLLFPSSTTQYPLPKFLKYQEILSSLPRKDFLTLSPADIAKVLSLRLDEKPDQEIHRCIISLQHSFPLLSIKNELVLIKTMSSWLKVSMTIVLENSVGLGSLKHSWWLWVESLKEDERIIFALQFNITSEFPISLIIPRLETGYRLRFINDNLSHCQLIHMLIPPPPHPPPSVSDPINKCKIIEKLTLKKGSFIDEIGTLEIGKNYLIMAPLRAAEFISLQRELYHIYGGFILESAHHHPDLKSAKGFIFVNDLSKVEEILLKKNRLLSIVAFSPPLKDTTDIRANYDFIISFDPKLRSSPLRIDIEPLPTDRRNCLPSLGKIIPLLSKMIFNSICEFGGPSLIICPSREIALRLQRSLKTILMMEVSSSSSNNIGELIGDIMVMDFMQLKRCHGCLIDITYLPSSTTKLQFNTFRETIPSYGMMVFASTLSTDMESDVLSSIDYIIPLLLEVRDRALIFVNEDMISFYRNILEDQRILFFK